MESKTATLNPKLLKKKVESALDWVSNFYKS